MTKVLSVVGPTAVGKTNFALEAAEHLLQLGEVAGVDIISADSRQVYRGLEIMSGVDVPVGFEERQMPDWSDLAIFFEKDCVRLFGVLLLQPDQEWSVSQFQDYAQRIIEQSRSQNRLPIIVGGTGLYQHHLFTTDPQLHIPPSREVRQQAETLSLAELQAWLQKIDSKRFETMNQSDQQNPRRLVRAIEISLSDKGVEQPRPRAEDVSHLVIGLTDSIETITERIAGRVQSRFEQGAVAEVEQLLARYSDQKLPIWSATGVKPILALVSGQASREECLELWIRQERQYAKRQLTWWKKRSDVVWFTISETDWQSGALDTIEAWWKA